MTTNCPHCGGAPEIPLAVRNNCQRFNSTPVVRTRCCGYGVRLVPHFTYTLEAVPRNKREDSFGVALNRNED